MKSLFKVALSALAGVCGLIGMQAAAPAVAIQPANVCAPLGNQPGLVRYPDGFHNNAQFNLAVVCPVIRTAAASPSGFSVWVDGWQATWGGGQCGLASYLKGSFLGSTTRSISNHGLFSFQLTLSASQVPMYASLSAWCVLTPGSLLYDVEPVQ